MPSITSLPYEVVALVLKNLDHLRSLPSALLTCRHFYAAFKASYGVEAAIFRHQISPALVPYAVAVAEASLLPRPLHVAPSSVRSLLDELHRQPERLAARLSKLPGSLMWKISLRNDAIHALATDYAATAMGHISRGTTSTETAVTATEWFRFCRAFYKVELFYHLFRSGTTEITDMMYPYFFGKYPPWENEQLGCVSEYLEARLAAASCDVFAHDVEFGALSIDYLSVGEGNSDRQGLLSRGVEFVHKLTLIDSYDVKCSMLRSALKSVFSECHAGEWYLVTLPDSLRWTLEDHDGRRLRQFSTEELLSLADRPRNQSEEDADCGPYEAWRLGNADSTLERTVMCPDTSWLRKRAYVLWDGDRVRKQRDGIFENEPGEQADYTSGEYWEMVDSFIQRFHIWKRGGRGYWSRDDLSRVEWPDT